jgi:hypothetical protein
MRSRPYDLKNGFIRAFILKVESELIQIICKKKSRQEYTDGIFD